MNYETIAILSLLTDNRGKRIVEKLNGDFHYENLEKEFENRYPNGVRGISTTRIDWMALSELLETVFSGEKFDVGEYDKCNGYTNHETFYVCMEFSNVKANYDRALKFALTCGLYNARSAQELFKIVYPIGIEGITIERVDWEEVAQDLNVGLAESLAS